MSWEHIEPIRKTYPSDNKLSPDGLRFASRGAPRGRRYLALQMGANVARKAAFTADRHGCHLLVGVGSDAGRVKIQVDNAAGRFTAKKHKSGCYVVTIDAGTADGLFALDFARHDIGPGAIEIIRPENGQPVFFVFKPSPDAFAKDD